MKNPLVPLMALARTNSFQALAIANHIPDCFLTLKNLSEALSILTVEESDIGPNRTGYMIWKTLALKATPTDELLNWLSHAGEHDLANITIVRLHKLMTSSVRDWVHEHCSTVPEEEIHEHKLEAAA